MAVPGRKFRYTSRRTKSARLLLMVVALFGITGLTGYITGKTHNNSVTDPQQQQQHRVERHVSFPQDGVKKVNQGAERGKGEFAGEGALLGGGVALNNEGERNCTPRTVEEFPDDFFTLEQKQDGAVVVHILIVLYTFGALAIVCDDYFVASLEFICEVLGLQSDVAGATFMAAVSSAPELFTSFIGLFFADSDIGVGTIVGSAVFNILFIIGICGIGAGMVVYLTWWPLFRDATYYTLTVVALIVVIFDEEVYWYESTVFLGMYIIYVLIMYFNPRLGKFFMGRVDEWRKSGEVTDGAVKEGNVYSLDITSGGEFGSSTREEQQANGDARPPEEDDDDDDEYESPLTFPRTLPKRLLWIVMLPVIILFFFTIPDCRRPGCWKKTYMFTFINSIIWISGLSYLMVWMVAIIGDTFGIPDTVMGLTLLAAGTSIPDALSSLFVARDGYGDMAVSNSIGSNVFDILIGLGLPWFIQTVIIETNDVVRINSAALTFSAISLLATVVFLLATVIINRWRLTKLVGVICLIVYVIFLVFACLYELNVFGELNPPPCPREE